jgi:hypothetical protein
VLYEGRPRVSTLSRILFVLLAVRLLMPPGICICKQTARATNLLASDLGKETPPPLLGDDDHAPGCPASYLSQGMGVAPPSGPLWLPLTAGPSTLALPAPDPAPLAPLFSPPTCLVPDALDPGDPALYLTLCALLI